MVQVNANSTSDCIYIHSTPLRKAVLAKQKTKEYAQSYPKGLVPLEVDAIEYDEKSFVRYTNLGKPNMSFELLPEPIFEQAL